MTAEWNPMGTAPRDGTLILLLIQGGENRTEDADLWPTVGANSFEHTEEDVWQFAGWNWCSDEFTVGQGQPVGWLPITNQRQKG